MPMGGKTVFKRSAVQSNIVAHIAPARPGSGPPLRDINPVVTSFSQLRVVKEAGSTGADVMKKVAGDYSPLSYLQAAICYHLLNPHPGMESNSVIDESYVEVLRSFDLWPFGDIARSLNPLFFRDSLDHPVVVFFTYHRAARETIVKHVHRFNREGYSLKYGSRTWAVHNRSQLSLKRIK